VWFDFRDAFGTLWGLRVVERFNDTARRSNWPVRLGWRGFEFETRTPLSPSGRGVWAEGAIESFEPATTSTAGQASNGTLTYDSNRDKPPPELTTAMRAAMASLLWRFVSDEWLQRRWPGDKAPAPEISATCVRA
jgi:hypothetical protein